MPNATSRKTPDAFRRIFIAPSGKAASLETVHTMIFNPSEWISFVIIQFRRFAHVAGYFAIFRNDEAGCCVGFVG
jgi:hypothetical protein